MSQYIKKLIAAGENQQLDFKFEISDSKKIARTFSAFANTDGGILLIGVKDNGSITGVRTDEEYYMAEAAARLYCKPEVYFTVEKWTIDGKTVLEIKVPRSKAGPHYSRDKNDRWMAYIRVNDENILANPVLLKVWKRKNRKSGIKIMYSESEELLLDFLSKNDSITITRFAKLARLPYRQAQAILADLISIDVIDMNFTEKKTPVYVLKKKHVQEK